MWERIPKARLPLSLGLSHTISSGKGKQLSSLFLYTEMRLFCFLRVVRYLHSPHPHEKPRKYLPVTRRGIRIGSRPTTEGAPWRRAIVALDD